MITPLNTKWPFWFLKNRWHPVQSRYHFQSRIIQYKTKKRVQKLMWSSIIISIQITLKWHSLCPTKVTCLGYWDFYWSYSFNVKEAKSITCKHTKCTTSGKNGFYLPIEWYNIEMIPSIGHHTDCIVDMLSNYGTGWGGGRKRTGKETTSHRMPVNYPKKALEFN